ncbi:MAG TPA: ABC transporter substrate-binding protein [Stellaceae bacterium]|nr:ABC transporter substrate-binding protein [Stellaceae bacterium]
MARPIARLWLVCLCALLAGPAAAKDAVTIGLTWTPQAEFGGLYQALADGIYDAAGLDVTLRPGGPQVNTTQLLVSGAIDMEISSNSFEPLNMVRQEIPFIAVAALYQKDPQILISHPEMGFKTLGDLKGHPVLIAEFAHETFWAWLKSKYGFTDDQARPYTFSLQPFIVDKTLSQQGYLTVEPFLLAAQGIKPTIFLLSDYGYNPYTNLLVTSKKMVAEKPDLVQRVVDATIKGWYGFLYGSNQKAIDLIVKSTTEYTPKNAADTLGVLKSSGLIDSGDTKTLGIGAMTDARWQSFFQTMVTAGVYKSDLDYHAAYTTQFVDKKVGMQ